MIYVTSDLHGYPLRSFIDLLRKANFGGQDFLFVLGDVIDRNGDGGVAMLQWLMLQPNVELLRGNHESMLLECDFLFEEITDQSVEEMSVERIQNLSRWMLNGGNVTLDALSRLRRSDRDAFEDVIDYLRETPLYETVEAGGRDFLLVHAGLGGFEPGKPLSQYAARDLIWHRPAKDERYFDHVTTVLGHTPTEYYDCPGRAFCTDTWIDVDTGAAGGGAPMLLRLDDLQAFYAD